METTTITANGIVCGGCANGVKGAVSALAGVAGIEVAIPEKRVTVTHDERVTREILVETLKKAGYQPA